MIIAVTGSIGSGKSIVALKLTDLLGAEHCDTDKICKRLMEKGQPGWQKAVAKWGGLFLDDNDDIDRISLREAIFDDVRIRQDLENILHPLVYQHVHSLKSNCERKKRNLIIEIPLLFETRRQDDYKYIIAVIADKETCITRIMNRDGVSRKQAIKVLDSQMDATEKAKRSHFVVNNSGSIQATYKQVEDIFLQLKAIKEAIEE